MGKKVKLYVISHRHLNPPGSSWLRRLSLAARAGASMVQIREKDLSDRDLFEAVQKAVRLCRPWGCRVLVNGRCDVALAANADGVHLGKQSVDVAFARRALGPKYRIGYSAHSIGEIRKAAGEGADFVTFSPVFPTQKPWKTRSKGIAALRRAVRRSPIPVYALGGISPSNAETLRGTGAEGLAVMSALACAPSPTNVVKYFSGLEA